MTFDINIQNDLKNLKKSLNSLEKEAYPKAVVRSLNRTSAAVKSLSSKHIGDLMDARKGDVKRRITDERATFKRWWSTITATGRPLRLIAFKARQVKQGVKAKAWNRNHLYKGAFIAPIKKGSSKKAVYIRKTKKRHPLKQLYGPGIVQLFKQPHNAQLMNKVVHELFMKEFINNLRFYISKIKK